MLMWDSTGGLVASLAMSVEERDSSYSSSTILGNLDRPLLSFFTIKITKETALLCLEVILEEVMLPSCRHKTHKTRTRETARELLFCVLLPLVPVHKSSNFKTKRIFKILSEIYRERHLSK